MNPFDVGTWCLNKSLHDRQFPDAASVGAGRFGGMLQDDRATSHEHGSGKNESGQEQFGGHMQLIKLFGPQKVNPPWFEEASKNLAALHCEDAFSNL
jgi:hypothetical protein